MFSMGEAWIFPIWAEIAIISRGEFIYGKNWDTPGIILAILRISYPSMASFRPRNSSADHECIFPPFDPDILRGVSG